MSDSESLEYLQPGFDPRSMTVPEIRSKLVKHNVSYPANAKKPQLVELFTEHVVPQAKKYLAAQRRAKRSSMGIVNADDDALDETELPPPRMARRSRSPRKASTRVKAEDSEPEIPPTPASTRRKQRSTSRQLAPASDTDETDATRSTRRSRRTVTPQIKLEDLDEDDYTRRSDRESAFTDDNPFQSGSSPPPVVKTPAGSRRKTTGMETPRAVAPPSSRRRTDGPISSEVTGPSISRTFEIPVSKLSRSKTPEPPVIEAGEEFTPDEQLELEELAASGEMIELTRKPQPRRRMNLSTPLFALFLALLCPYLVWYRQEKIAVGYCGLGRRATQVLPPEIVLPDWLEPFVEPQCETCPQHAYCYEDFSVRCEPDFVLKPHPLSFGGLVPLPPTCEPDGEKVRRVQMVADKAVEELRERTAKFECGELVDEEGNKEETPAIEEEKLKEVVSKQRNKRMNQEEFDDLWLSALGEVKAREEVKVVE
jgi:hypothetical protein